MRYGRSSAVALVLVAAGLWATAAVAQDASAPDAAGQAAAVEAASAPLRVFVIRHAPAWKNVPAARRPRPMSADELDALTPDGLERARSIAKELAGRDVVAVYTSPAQRAQQTAEAIAAGLTLAAPTVEPAFRTLDTGTDARAASGSVRARNWQSGRDPRPPGGESLADGLARATAALEAIAHEHGGHAVVVVTHGEIAAALRTDAAGQSLLSGYFDHFPREGSIHEIFVREAQGGSPRSSGE